MLFMFAVGIHEKDQRENQKNKYHYIFFNCLKILTQ